MAYRTSLPARLPIDLIVKRRQRLAEFLEAVKRRDFLLRLAPRRGIRKGFGHSLAGHSPREAELGIVAGIVRFGAMARRLATAPDSGGNRPGAQIAQARKLPKIWERSVSRAGRLSDMRAPILCIPFCTYTYAQNYAAKIRKPDSHYSEAAHPGILFANGAKSLLLSSCDPIGILPLKSRKSIQRSKQKLTE